ncbi:MAG: hypothetical protein QXX41_05650 [Nitrososphaerota archaeon]
MILGLIASLWGSLTQEKANLVTRKESERSALTLSVQCKKGQKLGFGISVGDGWEWFMDTSDEFKVGGQYIDYVPVTVLITMTTVPSKNITLEVEYSPVKSQGPTVLLDVFIIKVIHKSDIMKMETSIESWMSGDTVYTSEYLNERKPQLGVGIVQYDGEYQIEIIAVGHIKPPPQPPKNIVVYIYNVEKARDYWYFIPTGSMIIVLGAFIIVKEKRKRKKARARFAKSKHLKAAAKG